MNCSDMKKRLGQLEADRTNVQEQWDLIRQYVVPYRGDFFRGMGGEASVEWKENRRVFDSTAINANNILASSLHGAITNPSHQWFGFRFQDEELGDNTEAAQWLRDAAKITFETLRDSNFNLQANECYLDLTSFGSGFLTREVLEKDGEFKDFLFQSTPLKETFFEQDYRGRVSHFYRKMQWTPQQVVSKFGDKTPDTIKEKAKTNAGTPDICIVFCVYRRTNIEEEISGLAAPEQRPFGYKYFLYDNAEQIGDEGGYYSMPALAMRWRKTSESVWGNSPAMVALPDIMTLNELVELILNSLEKVVDPAVITTERGLLTDLDLGAGGLNVLREMSELAPFESRARFDVAELNRDKLQQSIRSIFYIDQLEMKDSPAMTATEVSVRYELMQRLLGPTLGRLEADFLDPLVSSVFADLLRYKRIPPPPDAVTQSADPAVNIEYTGPMARAQKLDQAQSLMQFLGAVSQMAEVNPQMLDRIDWDESVAMLAEYYQAEPKVLKSKAEVKKLRKDKQEQEKRMMQAQVEQAEGEGMQAMGKGAQSLREVQ